MDDFCITAVFGHPKLNLKGNTAAVIYRDSLPSDTIMQHMATELNQPATTFLSPHEHPHTYNVRWFAPDGEIELCGHGSLAALAFLNQRQNVTLQAIKHTVSGRVTGIDKAKMHIRPIHATVQTQIPSGLEKALGTAVEGYFKTTNKDIVLLESEDKLRAMIPDFSALREIDVFGYAVTAPGKSCDFVSRTLVPHVGQLEDHATGSSHAALAPFWAKKLKKSRMIAHQLSPRGGFFEMEVSNKDVLLAGFYQHAVKGVLSQALL